MVGLSIGVHLLNLVAIPALGFIYYSKKYKPTAGGWLLTFLISGAILLIIMSGIITGLPEIAGKFELFFVNSIGIPFGSGIIVFALLLIGLLIRGIYYSAKKNRSVLNTALLCFAFILIGYSSYAVIVVRSGYDPPIDENDPEDVMSFVSYLKREQYEQRPLLYGNYYNTPIVRSEKGAPVYKKGKDNYFIADYKTVYKYDPEGCTLFPRMASRNPEHAQRYKELAGIRGSRKPNMADNLRFMFRYQISHMYWRYFMWNFAGRESDIQNAGWLAPWDSGDELPPNLKNNRARNNFYMLPLLLGLAGMFFQFNRRKKDALLIGLLFFLTGIAIIIYLNQPPIEPRERDYTYVGSFYAFCIWIGLGVLALTNGLYKLTKSEVLSPVLAGLLALSVPGIMAAEGWDDHDRSNRYLSVDQAKNLLNSCAPNAILFTGGDNDTFPLWYVQNVEGFRTDVRVIVHTYLSSDWYIAQMAQRSYQSDPLPVSLGPEEYMQGRNEALFVTENPNLQNGIPLKQYLELIKKKSTAIQIPDYDGVIQLPSGTVRLYIDKDEIIKRGIVPKEFESNIVDTMIWSVKTDQVPKSDLFIMDLIATNNWERPIYFNGTSLDYSTSLDLQRYTVQEGLAYRLLPVKTESQDPEARVNSDLMYTNLMNRFVWRETTNRRAYYDDYYQSFARNMRINYYLLAQKLYDQNRFDKARKVINKCFETFPNQTFPYTYPTQFLIPLMFKLKQEREALKVSAVMAKRADEVLTYYLSHPGTAATYEIEQNLNVLALIYMTLKEEGRDKEAATYQAWYDKHASRVKVR